MKTVGLAERLINAYPHALDGGQRQKIGIARALLSAIFVPEVGANQKRIPLCGELSSPIDLPNECRFAKRCSHHCEACEYGILPLIEVSKYHLLLAIGLSHWTAS